MFQTAAIEWLAATNQPIHALEHPKFKEMIDIASRAEDGVQIPGRKSIRVAIIQMFVNHLKSLKLLLNIGHVTCDNAANNSTMMQEFAKQSKSKLGKDYPWKERKLGCLAHVINLATQVLIKAYSSTPHFDPKNPTAHLPTTRDEVGLVRAITVKVILETFIV
ncbi:hypothetical protein H0H92_010889 [Tricholoma furcatifolium]|nr:hypothetical protein H0H92_010889 [Tricholoma furcatifolium]